MLFPTIEFALFFIIVFTVNWLLHKHIKAKTIFLVIVSYIFYSFSSIYFPFLLLLSVSINYLFGKYITSNKDDRIKKVLVTSGIVFNLLVLGFFKYYNFFAYNSNLLFKLFKINPPFILLEIIVPIGISFYTFQAISYLIDTYREEIENLTYLDVVFYISFFPQLLSGPIIKASNFFNKIISMPDINKINANKAFALLISGLFKKLIIADFVAQHLVDPVLNSPNEYIGYQVLLAVYGYAIQIFCDFSAYSDMAIGIALLLGYEYPENFKSPYRANSVQDFWKRWHISLSSWLMTYLFTPMQIKFRDWKNAGSIFALITTFTLCGIWHGASVTFLIWGFINGAAIAFERFVFKVDKKQKSSFTNIIGIIITFHFVCASWILFKSETLEHAISIFSSMFNKTGIVGETSPFIYLLVLVGFLINFIPESFRLRVRTYYDAMPIYVQSLVLGALIIIITAMGPDGVPAFIYFNF